MRMVARLCAVAFLAGPALAEVREVGDLGLSGSEAARYDAVDDRWLVTNLGPRGPGNDGYVTVVSPAGSVVAAKWIAGGVGGVELTDPFGILVNGETIYVVDPKVLRTFDRASGKPLRTYPIPDAVRLNDVAVDKGGTIYVTDSGNDDNAGAIYRIKGGKTVQWAKRDPALERPNGIAILPDGTIIHGGKGVNMVIRTPSGKIVREITLPTGQTDGIVALADGGFYVSSQLGRNVYHVPGSGGGKPTVVAAEIVVPAAIGLDTKRNRLAIPQIARGTLTFVDLPPR